MRISQIAPTSAVYHLNLAANAMNKSSEKLASGKRILSAADDPAGLAKLQTLKMHYSTAKVANEALQSAQEFANVKDKALMQINDIIVQLTELYAADDYNDESATTLQNEIQHIVDSTTYNGKKVFDAQTIGGVSFAATALTSTMFEKTNIDTASTGGKAKLGAAIATLGGQEAGISARTRINETTMTNIEAAISRLEEVDIEKETIEYNKQLLLSQIGTAMIGKQNSAMNSILNLFG